MPEISVFFGLRPMGEFSIPVLEVCKKFQVQNQPGIAISFDWRAAGEKT